MADVRLIDANALRLMKVEECAGHTIEFAAGWKACVEYCKNDAPAIEAEPVKHGRWIRKNNSFPQRYFCTECGEGDVGKFAFCHHCGSKQDL